MYFLALTACIINIPISVIILFPNATESISLTFRLTEYLSVTRHVATGVHTLHVKAVSFINPRRACAARVTVVVLCVCVSVCLCVYDYSRTTGY